MMVRADRWRKGFTLLEVMVATSIVAIVLVAVLHLHMQTISMARDAKFYTLAPMLGEQALADFEQTLLEEGSREGSGNFEDDFSGYRWQASVENIEIKALGTVSENLKKIVLSVFYEDQFLYQIEQYRFIQK